MIVFLPLEMAGFAEIACSGWDAEAGKELH